MADNQSKFNDIVYQITDRTSWMWSYIAQHVMNYEVPWYGFDGKQPPEGQRRSVTLGTVIGWLDTGLTQIINGNAAILAAVKAQSEKQGIDPAELERIITEAVRKSAGTYELRKVEDTDGK